MLDYFGKTYVTGVSARGQRRAVAPRYPPALWNQHNTAISKTHRTNNTSEGWHNRFQIVTGRHHPDMFSALQEFQKEQAETESSVAELALGRKVRASPKQKWLAAQTRIQTVTTEYEDYKEDNTVLEFLRALSYNINI